MSSLSFLSSPDIFPEEEEEASYLLKHAREAAYVSREEEAAAGGRGGTLRSSVARGRRDLRERSSLSSVTRTGPPRVRSMRVSGSQLWRTEETRAWRRCETHRPCCAFKRRPL